MDYAKLEYFVSQPRLDRFLSACNNSKTKAQKLYRINLQVSQAFYPILNLFEIFLRNSINDHVSRHFDNPNWILHEKTGFMNDLSLSSSKYFLKNCVQNAEKNITRKHGIVSAGKVIAEQTLGFWTSLFETHHYRLIGGVVIHCFIYKPSRVNRSIIAQKLTRIRKFRNRVYHNEPICFSEKKIDFTSAIQIKSEIYELFTFIDGDLSHYVEYFDSIDININAAQNL